MLGETDRLQGCSVTDMTFTTAYRPYVPRPSLYGYQGTLLVSVPVCLHVTLLVGQALQSEAALMPPECGNSALTAERIDTAAHWVQQLPLQPCG